MLLTLLFLAARRGEVFRLKWSDNRLSGNTVMLWTRKRAGGDLESDVVPMVERLKQVLLACGASPHASEYVFVNLRNMPFVRSIWDGRLPTGSTLWSGCARRPVSGSSASTPSGISRPAFCTEKDSRWPSSSPSCATSRRRPRPLPPEPRPQADPEAMEAVMGNRVTREGRQPPEGCARAGVKFWTSEVGNVDFVVDKRKSGLRWTLKPLNFWRPQGDLNPCYRRERGTPTPGHRYISTGYPRTRGQKKHSEASGSVHGQAHKMRSRPGTHRNGLRL
jgi:hypothetical protein